MAIGRIKQNMGFPQFVIGGQGGLNQDQFALFKKSNTYGFALWRTKLYKIGMPFEVMQITIPIVSDFVAGFSIIPKLYFDDGSRSVAGTIINLNNYANTNKLVTLTGKNFGNQVHGESNFFLEFQIVGSALSVIGLPIEIQLDVHDS
jgi:hypothetical protein